jgi:hypothetical protein
MMRSICRAGLMWVLMVAGGTSFFVAAAQVGVQVAVRPVARVSSVAVTSGSNGIEVEITANQPVAPRSQVTTGPDRLVLDFPDTLPGSNLHNQIVNRGEVKGIRVGLFAQNPPVTRVVIDLKSPQHYRIYPSGKTVIVKLMTDQQQAAMRAHVNAVSYSPEPPKPAPKLEVEYQTGRLSILADNVSLAQVLNEIHRKTGTDIPIPPGAAQEQMVANIGPLPLRDAVASLLNGSRFNFIMVGSETDPAKLKSVILTYRGAGGMSQPAMAPSPQPPVTENEPDPEPQMQPEMQAQPQETPPQETPQPQENPPPQ